MEFLAKAYCFTHSCFELLRDSKSNDKELDYTRKILHMCVEIAFNNVRTSEQNEEIESE